MQIFNDFPVVGFSTFGELLGVNINETLSAIFFYKQENGVFSDVLVDFSIDNTHNIKHILLLRKCVN